MLKVIVFDLDDTLFDSTAAFFSKGMTLAIHAMIKAGLPGDFETIRKEELALFQTLGPYFSRINQELCKLHGIIDPQTVSRISEAADGGYDSVPIQGIKPFPGVRQLLAKLQKQFTLVLISMGKEDRQRQKIKELKLESYFDFICTVDGKTRSKSSCLRQVLEMYHFSPREICVVGDRIDSEIRHGNELGMITIRLLHGKYRILQPRDAAEHPMFQIKKITEIEGIVQEIQN